MSNDKVKLSSAEKAKAYDTCSNLLGISRKAVEHWQSELAKMQSERDQLAASNARLAYQLEGYLESIDLINQEMIDSNGCPTAVSTRDGWDVVYSNPQQSLAEIQARAVECAAHDMSKESWRNECGVDDVREWLFSYAGDIRISEEKEREK